MRAIIFIFLMAVPVSADVTTRQGKTVDCYCTDRTGARVELGETICMEVDGRAFLATCKMSLNVPIWREVSGSCVVG